MNIPRPATDVFVEVRDIIEEEVKVFHIFREAPSSYLRVVFAVHCFAHLRIIVENPGADLTTCILGRTGQSHRVANRRSEEERNEKDGGEDHGARFVFTKSGSQGNCVQVFELRFWVLHL